MKKSAKHIILFFLLIYLRGIYFGQSAPNLGELNSYSIFTSLGNVTNTGLSYSIGNVGTNSGTISGFAYNINGIFHDTDPSSALASTDLSNVFANLGGQAPMSTLGSTLGNGQIDSVLIWPETTTASNYGFDVTPARLVTGLITELGVCEAKESGILSLFPEYSTTTA